MLLRALRGVVGAFFVALPGVALAPRVGGQMAVQCCLFVVFGMMLLFSAAE